MSAENCLTLVLCLASALCTTRLVLKFCPSARRELEGGSAASRLLPLDGLRGILCIGVVIHHAAVTHAMVRAGGGWPRAESPLFELLGHSAVAFFFCITGFLFWGRAIEHGIRYRWLAFYRGRVFRIVPLYMLMAALAATVLLLDRDADAIGATRLANFFGEVFSFGFRNWSPILVGTHQIRTESFDAGVHWTLRYEWMFYIALPALALFARGWRPVVIVVLALIAILAIGTRSVLPISLMFGIGMYAAHVARSDSLKHRLTGRAVSVVVLIAVALLAICVRERSWMFRIAPTANGMSPLAFILTAAIFVPIACGNTMFGTLERPALRLLGTVSYSVYLLHGVILYVARPWIIPLVAPAPSSDGAYWFAIAGVTAVITALSCITYAFIERPFILWDKRLRARVATR